MIRTPARYRLLAMFVLPALVVYVAFAVYPLLSSVFLSFFESSGQTSAFVGVANYVDLFTNPTTSARFWNALGNNVEFFLIHLLVELPVGLLMAALLTSGRLRRSVGLYRTLLFVPATLSVVIVGFIWRLIINPLWGVVDFPLLGLESTALPTISLMSVWQYIGIPMIFLYTALLAIPDDVIEASRIDGAGAWTAFWRIKFPLIAPQFGLIVILTYIWTFNGFDIVYALNGSAPGPNYSTDILGTFFYRSFFGSSGQVADLDLGATVASVIFLLILVTTAAYFWVVQRRLKSYEL
ncbi:carbohydrate ABC transporter permease [Microbacterium sp. W4I20]|uniref:carbohydrate ABC transporter permease n=1 Tax=Microbacterium sp. W4I20 TaxID=3042262 RepID=UPI002782C3D3|nr:sugar ABC transporter permease [Microbacterium sp. W4I20]MDQ0727838.1 raffinose/stachyose/melibiose transport system permease protein [Microbacterium sp. W4I20]